jgi:GNAT superfamily N-acetyltransferase
MMTLKPFEAENGAHHAAAAAIWNAACGPDLAISPAAVRFNTAPVTGATQAGRVATIETGDTQSGDQAVGFVLASAFPEGDPVVSPRDMGWVDAIAVSPGFQRRGTGTALLAWAERWLTAQGCTRYRLGGSLRPFAAGLPVALQTEGFFRKLGYVDRPAGKHVWDVARSLRDYAPPSRLRTGLTSEVRPLMPGEEGAALAFFRREFPGRWQFEFLEFLAGGGRVADYLIMLTERGIDGFCQLTFEDSLRPMDRFFMHGLPRPWGQLGPIGISQACRGRGYGALVLAAGLQRLRSAGVDGCVIDWTDLLDFYGKYGFQPHRQYAMLVKESDG